MHTTLDLPCSEKLRTKRLFSQSHTKVFSSMEEEIMSGGFYVKNRGNNGGAATGGGGGVTKCGRWNPTAEQVKVLTDLFRAGLRTPSTDQIQKISSQLSFYGKIESKNVFYWFQNHKARERQKRRRVSCDMDDEIFKDVIIRRDHEKISSAKIFHDKNDVTTEAEREIETLQLFPIHSFRQADHGQKLRLFKSSGEYHHEAATRFPTFGSYMIGKDFGHPPLDLRLSFV